jgi:hypothetical protein
MPAVCFTKPGHEGVVSFADAPAWYDKNTEVPGEAIRLLAMLEGDPRRLGINLSPSSLDVSTTCKRQLLLKKFFPYAIDGIAEWQATEGTAWHAAFDSVVPREDNDAWHREVLIPDHFLAEEEIIYEEGMGHCESDDMVKEKYGDNVRLWKYTPTHESWEVQIFPGIWVNGRCDKLKKDLSTIEDFKTKAWAGYLDRKTGIHKIRHYPPGESDGIQLNAYARMVEVLTGTSPETLTIRRMYRGARDAKQAWKKYDIDRWSADELESKIRPHVEEFVKHATAMKDIKDTEEALGHDPTAALLLYIDNVSMDGEHMFNGKKCSLYCTQMPICFARAGKVRFETRADECQIIKPEDIT